MLKDTLQISAELIEVAMRLHALKFRHKWRIGDQFCIAEDSELFWQSLFADRIYLIDQDLLNLMDEITRQGVTLEEETEKMIFIPRLEDIVEFCANSVFELELKVKSTGHIRTYTARLTLLSEDKVVCEETNSGLRIAALRALAAAVQTYLRPGLAFNSLPAPI